MVKKTYKCKTCSLVMIIDDSENKRTVKSKISNSGFHKSEQKRCPLLKGLSCAELDEIESIEVV